MEDKLLEMNFLILSRLVAHIELNRYRVDSQLPLSALWQKRTLFPHSVLINAE